MEAVRAGDPPRITLCMIVRDEEGTLGRCLASARGVVDEVVVVDTGSRDRTVAVAAAAGARVERFTWCDDFAAARNCALGFATGDWVLVLDADEVLASPDARERLVDFARSAGAEAGQVELENVARGGLRSRTLLTRFFARAPGVRYVRRIHEQLQRDGRPLRVRPTGVRVVHDGYAEAAVAGRDKLARNEALLRAQLADDPNSAGDAYDWYQLGRTLEVGERHAEALAAYEEAVARARDGDAYVPHLFESAATCLRALGRSRQALDWLGEVAPLFPERADMVFLEALLAMDVGELARAEAGYLRCLELGRGAARATAAESSLAAATLAPAHNLGVLYECTGRLVEARAAYERALGFVPDHAGARAGLARVSV